MGHRFKSNDDQAVDDTTNEEYDEINLNPRLF